MPRRVQSNPRPRVESSGQWRSAPRPVDWPARVEHVKARDESCRFDVNGTPCGSTDRPEVHHRGAPDDHRLEMLVLLCHQHHAQITGQQSAQARRAKRKPRQRPPEPHPGLL